MTSTTNIHRSGAELGADAAEVTGGGLRAVEIGVVGLLVLLFCPPLLTLTVVAAFSALAVMAVAGAAFALFAVPAMIVRGVVRHHRTHRSTVFLHRLRRAPQPQPQRARGW